MGDVFGDGLENELPVHEVRLDAFYIGTTPVTQAQWTCVMPGNPSRFPGDERPVEQVGWGDVQEFLQRLIEANAGMYDLTLPTEAQWEYAARSGGKNQRYAGGEEVEALTWHEGNSGGGTQPVRRKKPNDLGLYDMSGNVWEWCMDSFREDAYWMHAPHNPLILETGRQRVIRGGSWSLDPWSLRCSRRFSFPEEYFGAGLGFRLAMKRNPAR